MRLLIITCLLFLFGPDCCRGIQAQNTTQSETENGTHYTYTLRTGAVDKSELVQAFARASGVTVHARFSGDWTTTDDDGIEYSLNTRRHLLAVRYRGDDQATADLARQKAQIIREDLHLLEEEAVSPSPERGRKI